MTEKIALEPKEKKHLRRSLGLSLCILLSLASLCLATTGIVYVILQQKQMSDSQLKHSALDEQQIKQSAQTMQGLSKLNARLAQNEQALEQYKALSAAQDNRIKALAQSLSSQQPQNANTKELLNEAHYLVQLAQLNLTYQQRPAEAIALLKTASDVLNQANDPRFLNIQKAIASNLTALSALPANQNEQILDQLNTLMAMLPNLSVAASSTQKPIVNTQALNTQTASTIEPHASFWKRLGTSLLNAFRSIVTIQKGNSTELSDVNLASSRVQALILQAQWAVMQNNTAVFQQSLQTLSSELQRDFGSQNTVLQKWIQNIQALQTLQKPMPDLSETLSALSAANTQLAQTPAVQSVIPSVETPSQSAPSQLTQKTIPVTQTPSLTAPTPTQPPLIHVETEASL